jgi:hypothetical protein
MKRNFILGIILLNTISIFSQIKEGGANSFIVKKVDIDGQVLNTPEGYYKYKTKTFEAASWDMYLMIKLKNKDLVKHLIEEGYDITLPIFIKDFSDFTTNLSALPAQVWKNGGTIDLNNLHAKREQGYIITSERPTPAVKTTPLEYAKEINDTAIISILSIEFEKQQTLKKIRERNDSLRCVSIIIRKDSLLSNGYKLIIPGKGFDSFEIGKTSFEEVVNKLGNNFERIDHIKYSSEIYYKELGVSFFFYYKKNLEKSGNIFSINLKEPFKGVTSFGIELNNSIIKDVFKLHGEDFQYLRTDTQDWLEYKGIKFYFNRHENIGNAKNSTRKIIEISVI